MPASETEADRIEIGTVLAGKYRVDKILGQGGMGFVVAATHLQMEELVAMKFLHAAVAKQPDLVARFQREAKAARKIRSEHVVRILDVGTLESGAPYIIMEHLEGTDLNRLIRNEGPQSVTNTADFVLQACEALAEAHVQGMVHRDLKPANLFVARRADKTALIKVLDFGISKVTGADGSDLGLTKTNSAVLGSPLYMAPEQMRSLRGVDARTDIWSLGVILHEMLAGVTPYHATTLPELCAAILQDPPPPIRERRSDVPEAFAAVLQRCMEKDPAKRYADISALAEALAPFGTSAGKASAERIAGVFRAHQPERVVIDSKPPGPTPLFGQTDAQPMSVVDPIAATRELAATDGPVAATSAPPPKLGAATTGKAWAAESGAGPTGLLLADVAPARRKSNLPIVFGVCVALGAGVLIFGLTRNKDNGAHETKHETEAASASVAANAAAPPPSAPPAASSAATTTVLTAMPTAIVSATPHHPSTVAIPPVPPPPPVAVNVPAPPTKPAKPAYCEKAPATYDDAGVIHWKKECL